MEAFDIFYNNAVIAVVLVKEGDQEVYDYIINNSKIDMDKQNIIGLS